jgi:hypothetical protein
MGTHGFAVAYCYPLHWAQIPSRQILGRQQHLILTGCAERKEWKNLELGRHGEQMWDD